MRSNFVAGFEKTAGIVGTALKPLKWAGKGALKAAGGPLNAGLTGLGAIMEGTQGMKKMTDAATRG